MASSSITSLMNALQKDLNELSQVEKRPQGSDAPQDAVSKNPKVVDSTVNDLKRRPDLTENGKKEQQDGNVMVTNVTPSSQCSSEAPEALVNALVRLQGHKIKKKSKALKRKIIVKNEDSASFSGSNNGSKRSSMSVTIALPPASSSGSSYVWEDFPFPSDISIKLAQGNDLKVHQCVLTGKSEYFCNTLKSNNLLNEIDLKQLNPDAVKTVLVYMYCENINLDDDNIKPVTETAGLFVLDDLLSICSAFLEENIRTVNCLMYRTLAVQFNLSSALANINLYVQDNFQTSVVNNELVHTFDIETLVSVMSLASTGGQALQVVLQWITYDESERKQNLSQLLEKIDWNRVSSYHFNLAMNDPIVKSSSEVAFYISQQFRKVSYRKKAENAMKLLKKYMGSKIARKEGQFVHYVSFKWVRSMIQSGLQAADYEDILQPIDNSDLVTVPNSDRIKPGLAEVKDFMLVDSTTWTRLVDVFGVSQSQKELKRMVIFKTAKRSLLVHSPITLVCETGQGNEPLESRSIVFDSSMNLGQVKQRYLHLTTSGDFCTGVAELFFVNKDGEFVSDKSCPLMRTDDGELAKPSLKTLGFRDNQKIRIVTNVQRDHLPMLRSIDMSPMTRARRNRILTGAYPYHLRSQTAMTPNPYSSSTEKGINSFITEPYVPSHGHAHPCMESMRTFPDGCHY